MYMYIFLSPFVPPYIQKTMFNKDIIIITIGIVLDKFHYFFAPQTGGFIFMIMIFNYY